MEHFSNREEPNALEMTNVVKSLNSFLNAPKDLCHKFELIPTCFFYKAPKAAFTGRPKIKGHTFLPSFRLHAQSKTKLKNRRLKFEISRPRAIVM